MIRVTSRFCAGQVLLVLFVATLASAAGKSARSTLEIADAEAAHEKQMKSYVESIEHTSAKIDMLPIPGGKFLMGSPKNEENRLENEGPQHQVEIAPFWMSKCEITWDAFEIWMFDVDIQRRKLQGIEPNLRDEASLEYQLSQPTPPYTDMSFGMGKKGYPAICMTQLAAKTFCNWLSTKTGRYYRLPTEAEWEYACRAGTTTAYSFGDDLDDIDDYAWYLDNADERYQKVGKKKPNRWGLHDMHGNVAEWVLDGFADYKKGSLVNPLVTPDKLYPRIVRGGSWDDFPEDLRSAARTQSTPDWKRQDPQIPKSIWYHTDATHVGFRIVRPLVEPSPNEKAEKWDKSLPLQDRKSGRQ